MEETKKEEAPEAESNKALIITGIILAIFLAGIITNGFGFFNPKNSYPTISNLSIEIVNAPVLGNPNAPITIYEFSDFSCPYCAAADGENPEIINYLKRADPTWQAPIPEIIENYVNTGKVKLVFKYMKGHGTGQPAELVGWCLNEQGLFWKFHTLAFANQNQTNSMDAMKNLGKYLGANTTTLSSCLDSNKYLPLLQSDNQEGINNGLKGTPSFIINDKLIEGAASFSEFKKIIDSELKK